MTTETTTLELRAKYSDIEKADRSLDKLDSSMGRADTSANTLKSSFKSLIAPIAGIVSVGAGFNKFMSTARQTDVFTASLKTATGSAEDAAFAFSELERFAANTPFLLSQSVDGFVKLVNLGLKPSEEALTSYGNTASAMGKDLSQMIEAVADASTGEFERLKEFGIKASKQGDIVRFTFRGATKEVKNSSDEIQKYLMDIGNVDFAGAMSDRMDSLDGDLSNLQDTFYRVFRSIAASGGTELAREAVQGITEAMSDLSESISSGELQMNIALLGSRFKPFADDVEETLDIASTLIESWVSGSEDDIDGLVDFMGESFRRFPENVRAVARIAGVEIANFIETQKELISNAFGGDLLTSEGVEENLSEIAKSQDVIARKQERLIDLKGNYSSAAMLERNNLLSVISAEQRLIDELQAEIDKRSELDKRLESLEEIRLESISAILSERDAAIKSADDQAKAISSLADEYAKAKEQKKGLSDVDIGDSDKKTLGSFGVAPTVKASVDDKEIERIIERNTSKEELLKTAFERRSEIIRQAEEDNLINEVQANNLLISEEQRLADAQLAIKQELIDQERQLNQQRISDFGYMTGAIGDLLMKGGKKQFEIGKKISRLSVIANTAAAIMNEASQGDIWSKSFRIAGMVALGAKQLQAVNSTSFGGGGSISGGTTASPSTTIAAPTSTQTPAQQTQTNVIVLAAGGRAPDVDVYGLVEQIRDISVNESVSVLPVDSRDMQDAIEAAVTRVNS